MSKKRKARELAMQVLFLWDTQGDNSDVAAAQVVNDGTSDDEVRRDALAIAAAAWNGREIADRWVVRLAPQWPTRRQPGVDRSILRLAVWELTGGTQTPPKVVIDEAIELAKEFSTEQSPAFVNGVLDAILKEFKQITEGATPAAAATTEEQSPPAPTD
jgi:transcription antitermination protein NusB